MKKKVKLRDKLSKLKKYRGRNEHSYATPYRLRVMFGKNLKFYRKKRGYSQLKLSQITGLGINVLADYENGRRIPMATILCILCRSLRVAPHMFYKPTIRKDEIFDDPF
jgi:DNA-binding XRE family transcriptional regulator